MGGGGEVRFIGEVESVGETSTIRLHPEFCPGLLGVEGYSHLIILYWMHMRDDDRNRWTLRVTPLGTRGQSSPASSPVEAPPGRTQSDWRW